MVSFASVRTNGKWRTNDLPHRAFALSANGFSAALVFRAPTTGDWRAVRLSAIKLHLARRLFARAFNGRTFVFRIRAKERAIRLFSTKRLIIAFASAMF